jgi:hypothetical protein
MAPAIKNCNRLPEKNGAEGVADLVFSFCGLGRAGAGWLGTTCRGLFFAMHPKNTLRC